jgi:hypothetical protein
MDTELFRKYLERERQKLSLYGYYYDVEVEEKKRLNLLLLEKIVFSSLKIVVKYRKNPLLTIFSRMVFHCLRLNPNDNEWKLIELFITTTFYYVNRLNLITLNGIYLYDIEYGVNIIVKKVVFYPEDIDTHVLTNIVKIYDTIKLA